jgi:hypothetical protein
MIDSGTMVLQICTDFLKVEPSSLGDMYSTFSHDEDHIIHIKVEEDPIAVTLPGIKSETEVSLCLCVHVRHIPKATFSSK